jgi:hypothetical protein
MGTNRRPSLTQCTAWAMVIGGHLLLFLLFSNSRPRDIRITESGSVLLLLDLTPPPTKLPARPQRSGTTRARAHARFDTPAAPTTIGVPAPEEPVDWRLEAERSAHAISAEVARKEPKCDDSDRPWSLQPKCKKPQRPPEWEPEIPRAGFDRLIPYVRLGKRCILGLGFFGCAIGKLPEPNSHLFDDMNNPDRLRSSVPDVSE